MFLAGEHVLSAGDITVGGYEFIDLQPDILLGAPLYTNSTQDSILGVHRQPPFGTDAIAFRQNGRGDRLLILGARFPHLLTIRLIGVPVVGTVLTIGGSTYTAVNGSASPNSLGQFGTYGAAGTSNDPTVSEQIRLTALSLVTAINRRSGNTTLYADYLSSQTDPPGIITIRARTPVVPQFTAQASVGGQTYFDPPLDVAQSSAAPGGENRVAVSLPDMPSSFSLYSEDVIAVGQDGRTALRIAALRNDVFAFKDGEGIFKLTPLADGWNVEQMSQDANLLIPESVAVLDNQILAYTTRGIVSVDAYGVEELDLPVKNYTEALATFPPEVVQATTFAAADSTRLCYWLWFPETAGATVATRALLWNGRASPPAWTERTDAATGGYVSPDGFLMLGEAPQPGFTASRRTGSVDDFQGPDGDAYTVRISWPNRAEGMPGASKHYRQARLYFEKPVGSKVAPLPVQWLFTNDYANTSPVRTNQVYGLPYSTMEPDPGYQRTSDLGIEVAFPVLRAYPVVKGVEEVVSSVSPVRMRK